MEFSDFHKWVHRELGINLSAYKPVQLNRRIKSLMDRVGISSLEEYTKVIKNNKEERQRFLDFITINVTEFYRNPELFSDLENQIRKYILPENKNIKVWSAACSIGCEPYTLAMILKNINPSGRNTILATDLDNVILNKAMIGQYGEGEMKNVPDSNVKRYFNKKGDKYEIKPEIKSMVKFKKHDLILDPYEENFDLIVCRNVVIYFNNDTKDEIYKKFSKSLKKGGLLFIGATESIYRYKEFGFEKVSTFIYRKV